MISANSGCSGYATRSLAPRLIFLALYGTSVATHSATFNEKVHKPQYLNTFINASKLLGVGGTPGDLYKCIKPITFKIDDIDLKGRFVNLFGNFSLLCAATANANLLLVVIGMSLSNTAMR